MFFLTNQFPSLTVAPMANIKTNGKDRLSVYIRFNEDVEPGFAKKMNHIARKRSRTVKREVINLLKKHVEQHEQYLGKKL